MKRALSVCALAATLVACGGALTSRGAVLDVRYYDPEAPARSAAVAEAQAQAQPEPRPNLRLGRVRGAPDLRERIARRESEHEVGFYEDRQWTSRPEVFVRHALARELFEERGFERATGGAAPTLDVEVLAFEEVRTPHEHAARVALRYELQSDVAVLDERTVVVDRPVEGPRFEDFVAAMSGALDEASDRIADRIERVASR
jgi:cholesterol transport system auxiliary component